jgi:hypothetical protein
LSAATIIPSLEWAEPDPIDFGTPLSNKQLNAKDSVEGRFVYNPTLGATLPSGTDTLSVIFLPKEAAKYPQQTRTVALVVKPPKPASPVPATHAKSQTGVELLHAEGTVGRFSARHTKMT